MARKKRQRISYVLPLASTPGGHRLGINGLSFDSERQVLYTGGRDGVICAWDLNARAEYTKHEDKSLPSNRRTASFRNQVQAHTHWVNDIVLVKNNLAVASASSDASVKLWRPHSHDALTAYSIGSHSDYVKCLTTPSQTSNWVASAGLDSRICLWDLAGGGQTLEINVKRDADNIVKGSIYALKARHSVIASGGPDGVCRLWDVNSGRNITKLVGHTDLLRDILMSDDGDTILTASSDQTVKVWSMAEGRCLHTLTMHNDSVWCMYSDDPTLSVFYSGDKSGLVAKTDTRRAMEIDDGVSVAVCQEHDGIHRLAIAADSIWTATSNSSINRWLDVDTELEVETPPASPKFERSKSSLSQQIRRESQSSTESSSVNGQSNSTRSELKRIPHNAILRLSNTAPHPGRKHERNYSVTNVRKVSEAILDADLLFVSPIRGHPEETIEGQNGLTKHVILNDKKRVLTLDTAGEVVLWDLLKCVPIKSFGRKHLDEIVPVVNTAESVANWCAVDTKTGKLTIMLEENYAFDAEIYADEIEIDETIDFREDQRINLGKWVLRNLFTTLLDEELKRDEIHRRSLHEQNAESLQSGIQRIGAPTRIVLPPSQGHTPMVSPGALLTPKASNNYPQTPGLAIGLATPGYLPSSVQHSPVPSTALSPLPEGATSVENGSSNPTQPRKSEEHQDYFSTANGSHAVQNPSESAQPPSIDTQTVLSPTSPIDEKKKGTLFSKFQMNSLKKLGRNQSENPKAPTVPGEDKVEESDQSSEKEEPPIKSFDDNFLGVIQRIRQQYSTILQEHPHAPLPVGIVPSLPIETPVLRPPPHTLIIIQEDDPESGGLTDLYRGEISQLGKDADTLENVAPTWLGDLLLKNEIPFKETVKVSFVLHPYENLLPALANPADGNARLNANRMLRAKKIIAYICERIEAPPTPPHPLDTVNATMPATDAENDQPSNDVPNLAQRSDQLDIDPTQQLRPEDYLELYCQGQKVDPNMTLNTLRWHVWRAGGDIVLYYKANGRKEMKLPHPVDVAGRDEGMGAQVHVSPP